MQRDGIHCHGLRYFSITLAPNVGDPVTIRYDPRDLAEIRAYDRGEFLCRAVSPEIASVDQFAGARRVIEVKGAA